MKIAYIMKHDITKDSGVTKKVLDQVYEWKKQGNEVEVFCRVPQKGDSILSYAKQYNQMGAVKDKLFLYDKLLKDLKAYKPDLVYIRFEIWTITYHNILSNYKTVFELNSYNLCESFLRFREQKTLKLFVSFLMTWIINRYALKKVHGIIAVTTEIAREISNKFNMPVLCIPNSINLKNCKQIKRKKNASARIGLFFIGSANQSWQGVDIISDLAKIFPEYDFHIVGNEGKNTGNLFWYGYLHQVQYLDILKKCHICIGTLALHRKKMREACPIKVREYLAYGYPVIIGYKDTAFVNIELPDYILKINTESNSVLPEDIKRIRIFSEQYSSFVVPNESLDFIDSEKLEKDRVNFLKEL